MKNLHPLLTRCLAFTVLLTPGLLAPGAVQAQVPYGYLAVGLRTNAAAPAIVLVDPATRTATPAESFAAVDTMKEILTFALDPANPGVLYAGGSTSAFLGGEVWPLQLQGNKYPTVVKFTPTGMPGFAFPKDYHMAGSALLMTVSGGSNNGLYQIDLVNKNVVKLPVAVPNFAGDIAVIGTKAYVMSDTTPNSTIVEWDLTAQQSRIVGASYPRLRSMSEFGPNLIAGTDAGDLLLIAPATGAPTTLAQPGKGPILAVATNPVTGEVFFAVANGTTYEVWALANTAAPIYTTTYTISELRVSAHDVASLLRFGAGCVGTNNKAPRFGYVNVPALGSAAFTLQVVDAPPSTVGTLLLGLSRQTVDLSSIGMGGCTLYTTVALTLGTSIDAMGTGQLMFGIPNMPALKGGHATAQWAVLDIGANALNLISSDAAELIVR